MLIGKPAKTTNHIALATVMAISLLFTIPSFADPAARPLIRSDDFEYLGAFALHQGTYGGSSFGYSGNAALSIISCISSGPAATVFDPDKVGAQNPIPGTTLVHYPLSDYLVTGGVSTENTFLFGSNVKGIAFPNGSRSILFIGTQSLAQGNCYGPGTLDPELHLEPTNGLDGGIRR